MVRVYGCSDDLVEIEGAPYPYDEVGCFERNVRIWFVDGSQILVGYHKKDMGVWWIEIEKSGSADYSIEYCYDEDADIYSDIFEIDSGFVRCEVVKKGVGLE